MKMIWNRLLELHREKEQAEWKFRTILSDLCDPSLIHNDKDALFKEYLNMSIQ